MAAAVEALSPSRTATRILLLDDDSDVRVTLQAVLGLKGYQVEAVATADEALALLDGSRPFDVILADVALDENSDGLEVVRRGRELDPDFVAIVLTGYVSMDNAVNALRAGVNNFLSKPCNLDELTLAIEAALEKRQLLRDLHSALLEAAGREQAERLAGRLAVLQSGTADLAGATTRPEVARRILAMAIETLDASGGAVAIVSEDGRDLEIIASVEVPVPERWRRIAVDAAFPIADAVRRRAPVLLESLAERAERYPDADPDLPSAGSSWAAMPLLAADRCLGALALVFREERQFDDQDRHFIGLLSSQCAQALDRARIYDGERRSREIAEQTRAALDASNQALRDLIEACPLAVTLLDLDGTVRLWNPAAEQLYGWTEHEVVGRFVPGIPDAARSQLLSELQRVAGGETIMGAEAQRFKKDGAFFAQVWRVGVRDADGTLRCLTLVSDVSETRAAREELRRREEQFEALVEHSPDIITQVDRHFRLQYISRAAEAIAGRPRTYYLGKTHAELGIPADVAERWEQALERVFATGDRQEFEFEYQTLAGPRFYRCRVIAEGRSGATAETAMSVMTDVTEHRHAEDWNRFLAQASVELAGSLETEPTLQRVAQLAVPVLADWCAVELVLDGTETRTVAIAHVNPDKVQWAWQLQTRYPPDPDAPGGVRQVIRTGQPLLYPEIPAELLEAGARDEEHLRIIRELQMTSVMVLPLALRDRILGVITFISAESRRRYLQEDVSRAEQLAGRAALAIENARLYETEQRARQLAEALERQKDEFLSAAAHDLKTPLTAARGLAQLMQRRARSAGSLPAAAAVQGLDDVTRAVDRMSSLIDELLDVSRLGAGHSIRLHLGRVDLVKLAREAMEDCRRTTSKHEIDLSTAEPQIFGYWDAARLQRVLLNIIGNAVKYSPDGGRVTIELRRELDEAEQEYAVVEVADQGIGIAAEDRARIFERFERGGNVPARIPGTGIGLAYVRDVLQHHGGAIAVDSEPGRGSIFIIRLPLQAREGIG